MIVDFIDVCFVCEDFFLCDGVCVCNNSSDDEVSPVDAKNILSLCMLLLEIIRKLYASLPPLSPSLSLSQHKHTSI